MPSTAQRAEPDKSRKGSTIAKLLLLILILAAAFFVYRNPSVRASLTQEGVVRFVREGGTWAPVLFILVYTVWVCLFLPAIVVTGAASLLFPLLQAVGCIVVGATLGAAVSFLAARMAGRDLVARLLRGRVAAWDEGIGRNGFLFVLYSRLLYVPFTYYNFAAGLTKVSFRDFFWGTLLGVIPGTFIWVLFFGRMNELVHVVLQAPSKMAGLHSAVSLLVREPRYLLPVALLVSSLVIPVLLKRTHALVEARRESRRAP
jgi:uncharacterized membrane protein YdjX (TVP38/TMEM64 family)